MKILLTNDDGFGASGIEALYDVLSKEHDVWLVAPDQDRSGVSHGLIMNVPLCIKEKGVKRFSCSGLPANCAEVGIKSIAKGTPDLVLSGINKGANIGTDVIFSGTAAAARHASMSGIPGIAVSLTSHNNTWNFTELATFVAINLDKLVSLCEKNVFININAADTQKLKGAKFTTTSIRNYQDLPKEFIAPNGHLYSFFDGKEILAERIEGTDYTAVEDGYVAISRIQSQPYCLPQNNDLQNLDFIV